MVRTGKSGGDAQANVSGTRKIALATQKLRMAAEPAADRSRYQRIQAVAGAGDQRKQNAPKNHLLQHCALCGIDELRQKRDEEQHRLGIQGIDDRALPKNPPQAFVLQGLWTVGGRDTRPMNGYSIVLQGIPSSFDRVVLIIRNQQFLANRRDRLPVVIHAVLQRPFADVSKVE